MDLLQNKKIEQKNIQFFLNQTQFFTPTVLLTDHLLFTA